MIKAIAFDLDGVLWNSDSVHEEAFRTILRKPDFQYKPKWAGMSTSDVIEANCTEPQYHAYLITRKRALAKELLVSSNPVLPDLGKILGDLGKDYKLALVTGAGYGIVSAFLQQNNLWGCFNVVIAEATKPNPDCYIEVAKRLQVFPYELLVFEDSDVGVEAATKAKANVFRTSFEELKGKDTKWLQTIAGQ